MKKGARSFACVMATLLLLAPVGTGGGPAMAAGAPRLRVGSATGGQGAVNIQVPVMVSDNPGVNSVSLTVSYDETRLRLKDIHFDEDWKGSSQLPPFDDGMGGYRSPVSLNWVSAFADHSVPDATFAVLFFDVLDTAVPGSAWIQVSCDPDGTANLHDEPIAFEAAEGSVLIGTEPGALAAVLSAEDPQAVELTGPVEVLANCENVFAASYDGRNRMSDVTIAVQLDMKQGTVRFPRPLTEEYVLFFLDRDLAPVCNKIAISK